MILVTGRLINHIFWHLLPFTGSLVIWVLPLYNFSLLIHEHLEWMPYLNNETPVLLPQWLAVSRLGFRSLNLASKQILNVLICCGYKKKMVTVRATNGYSINNGMTFSGDLVDDTCFGSYDHRSDQSKGSLVWLRKRALCYAILCAVHCYSFCHFTDNQ